MKFVYFKRTLALSNYSLSKFCFTEKNSVRSAAKTSELTSGEFDHLSKQVDSIKGFITEENDVS